MDKSFRYEDKDWPKTDSKEHIFSLINHRSEVLDLGCWTGRLGEKLKKKKDCFVVGVDIDKMALKLAEKRLDNVYQVDLDQPDLLKRMLDRKFDFVVMADVLEHLKEPENILRVLKHFLKKNGCLLLSIPNIANWSIRFSLLMGKFEYTETGILDRTHLRHFTKDSARKLLEKSGYIIEKSYFTGTKFLPELKAVQFLFVCKI